MSRSFVAAVPTCLRRVADIAFKISIYLQKSMMLIDSWGTSPATTRQRFFSVYLQLLSSWTLNKEDSLILDAS